MPSPPVLDIDALLLPIPGDEPAGGPVPLPVRDQLELARKEIDPADFDANDPARPTEAKHAEWGWIVATTGEILAESSKDLMIAARLAEALVKVHGFAGLRDGMTLFRRLVEECWDRLRPVIEEPDDLEARAAAFNWLDDTDRGARFPTTVRQIPMFRGPNGPISWLDWNMARSGKGAVKPEEFEQAANAAPGATCQALSELIEGTIQELQSLLELLTTRMGPVAPGLTSLRQAVFECRTLSRQVLDRKGPEDAEPGEGAADGGPEGAAGGPPGAARSMNTRAQVYQTLSEAAEVLAKIEPHSPIPYMIRRAVVLGDLPFPELIKQLVRDASVLTELSRNLGIQELAD